MLDHFCQVQFNCFSDTRPTVKETAKEFTDQFVIQTTGSNGNKVGQLRDLLIIVDSSGSISTEHFNIMKTQLARLLGLLCPKSDPFNGFQQAALLQFSNTVREIFDFNDKSNTRQVQDGVTSMTHIGGPTCSATAFDYANNNMFTANKGWCYIYYCKLREYFNSTKATMVHA